MLKNQNINKSDKKKNQSKHCILYIALICNPKICSILGICWFKLAYVYQNLQIVSYFELQCLFFYRVGLCSTFLSVLNKVLWKTNRIRSTKTWRWPTIHKNWKGWQISFCIQTIAWPNVIYLYVNYKPFNN